MVPERLRNFLGAAIRIGGPRPGQVKLPVDHRVPAPAGVTEVDGDLGVLDPAGGAGVLPLHPDGVPALLQITGLVDDQDPVGGAEVLDDEAA
jgi:hypothetical protein